MTQDVPDIVFFTTMLDHGTLDWGIHPTLTKPGPDCPQRDLCPRSHVTLASIDIQLQSRMLTSTSCARIGSCREHSNTS